MFSSTFLSGVVPTSFFLIIFVTVFLASIIFFFQVDRLLELLESSSSSSDSLSIGSKGSFNFFFENNKLNLIKLLFMIVNIKSIL